MIRAKTAETNVRQWKWSGLASSMMQFDRARCPPARCSQRAARRDNKFTALSLQPCTHAHPTVFACIIMWQLNAFIIGWITQTHTQESADKRDYTAIRNSFSFQLFNWIKLLDLCSNRNEKRKAFSSLTSRSEFMNLVRRCYHCCTCAQTHTHRARRIAFFL